jgi:hypothetical protein
MALTVAAVDAIRAELAAVPPKDASAREVTRLEALTRMRGEVIALRERGYSWDEIAGLLSSKGCRVTAGTLQSEISRRGSASKSKKRDRWSRGDRAKQPGGSDKPAVGEKVTPPVKGTAPPARPAPEATLGGFVVREDSEI